jgi:diguanylate cyclase (GGDEF)-like protein/PAS domain S-box-containing protein
VHLSRQPATAKPADKAPVHGALSLPDERALVLVVDDERINREILSRMLSDHGHDVLTADSGKVALERLEDQLPDLVLLDVIMSGMSGFDVLKTIRSRYPDGVLPVIMVTAEAGGETVVRAFMEGANDYLTKPLDPQITLARISLQLKLSRALSELKRSQERYALAAQGSRIGLWDWDVAQRQIFLSARWKEMLGYSDTELDSSVDSWFERIHVEDREQFTELLGSRSSVEQGRFEKEIRMRHRDGTFRWMFCSGVVQSDADGIPRRLAGSLADVTAAKVRDVLTGLPNRLLFEEQLNRVLHLDRATFGFSAILFLDLDNFKLVNDSLGHDAGDLLLCSVAKKLESCLRQTDIVARNQSKWSVARHGGDEFTVLLHCLQNPVHAEIVAERIIAALSEPFAVGVHEVAVGVSIGIAYGGGDEKSAADAIREADTAMYYAKTSGRGGYRIFDPEMQTVASARLALECDLRQAIKSHQFYLEYQPIVRLATGRVEGFEALCRWKHPRGERIGPDVFVPVIESLGLISRLGRMVLEMACDQVQEWNRNRAADDLVTVTVNYSSGEFGQPLFRNDLLMTVARAGIDPGILRIEVTESTLMQNPELVEQVISELRDAGIRIGIDDFGTGYSSLAYLHRLPLDLLKIDKSFVRNMHTCSETRAIVRTIITLAQSLNLDIVAEGVETSEQQRLLFEMGSTHAQGYLYSKPIPGDAVGGFLDKYTPLLPPSQRRRPNEEIEQHLEIAAELVSQE